MEGHRDGCRPPAQAALCMKGSTLNGVSRFLYRPLYG